VTKDIPITILNSKLILEEKVHNNHNNPKMKAKTIASWALLELG
jgi:hypothetical protein